MRKIWLLPLLLIAYLQAQQGELTLSGDLLYWKPLACSSHYATLSTTGGSVTSQTLTGDSDFGFRATASFDQKCTRLSLSFLWLQGTDASQVRPTGNQTLEVPLLGETNWNKTSASLFQEYQYLSLYVGNALHRGRRSDFRLHGILRWISLERRLRVRAVDPNVVASYQSISSFEGAGLGFGAEAKRALYRTLSVHGRFNLMAIIGKRKLPVFNRDDASGQQTSLSRLSHTSVIPGLDLSLGLRYSCRCGSADLFIEGGYELDTYWQALVYGLPRSTGDDLTSVPLRCHDQGFAGPYLRIGGTF